MQLQPAAAAVCWLAGKVPRYRNCFCSQQRESSASTDVRRYAAAAASAAVFSVAGKVPRYSFVHSFGRLAKEQGLLGLWRGNTPYLLRHVPSISMSFAFKV
jgi:hypothetical protein